MANAELIESLNRALGLELAGVIQYLQHSFLVTGQEREVFRGFFRELSGEARDHAALLGDKILAVVGALPTDAVARDRDCAVQFVELIAVNTNRLLTTPAETFRPGEVPERDAFDSFVPLKRDLDLLIPARTLGGVCRRAARLHN